MYRIPTKNEITLLKRTFNIWGVFEVFERSSILIKEDSMDVVRYSNCYNPKNKPRKNKIFRIQVNSKFKDYNFDKTSSKKGVFLLNSDDHKIDVIKNQPYYAGLLMGYLHKNFFPSLSFLEIVATKSISFPYVIIKEQAANLVLYGRDVFGYSILSSSIFDENTLVLIMNSDRKPLGLGKTRYPSSVIFKENTVVVSNISDYGYYLREEN